MQRKCEMCKTYYNVTKNSLKRELVFKKGTVKTNTVNLPPVSYRVGMFKIKTYKRKMVKKYRATNDIYKEYFICPMCGEREYINYPFDPTDTINEVIDWECIYSDIISEEDGLHDI